MPSIAVIDLGSNSARLIVVELDELGHLDVIADARAGLRLLRRLQNDGSLSPQAVEATCQTVSGLATVARNAGAGEVIAVATAAIREAPNRDELVAAVAARTGVKIRVIDGDEEARLACRGAIHGLPAEAGISIDIGGGSLELATFTRKAEGQTWSLPLGALRLTDSFINGDIAKRGELTALRAHVRASLLAARVPQTGQDAFVGTGGTIRAVAKLVRSRQTSLLQRVHGFALTRAAVDALCERISPQSAARLARSGQVSADRAVSLVAGVNALAELMDYLNLDEMLVSGQGLREGIALDLASIPALPVADVRAASVSALAKRFAAWSQTRAQWRAAIAVALLQVLVDDADQALTELVNHAATLLDIGRSIDFYDRHAHTTSILSVADLPGFSQRDRARLTATVEKSGNERATLRHYHPLLDEADVHDVERAALVLALADGIEPRTHPNERLPISRRDKRREIVLEIPLATPWNPSDLVKRARRLFGKRLVIAGSDDQAVSVDVR